MKNIIDVSVGDSQKLNYLLKSTKICRLYLAFLIVGFLLSSLLKASDEFSTLFTILLGLSLFALFGLSPWGLYYCWRSKKTGEGHRRRRMMHTVLHSFICTLLLFVIVRFFMDVAALISR